MANVPLPYFLAGLGIVGMMVGSFLNVVIYRVPNHQSIAYPPSQCPKCGHRLRPWENIPVLSWVALSGRCSSCKTSISAQYPAIEILTAALTMLVGWQLGTVPHLLAALLFTWAILALSVIDLKAQLLSDAITKPGIIMGLCFSMLSLWHPADAWAFVGPVNAVIGTIAGYGSLWLVATAYRWRTGKTGMGGGDFKLLAMVGAWLGWQAVLMTIFLAAITGGAVALLYLLSGKGRHFAMPFGPYLALGAWLMMLWPQPIIAVYLSL